MPKIFSKNLDSCVVNDKRLGQLHFPKNDNIMAPFIQSEGIWDPNEFQWLEDNIKSGDHCLNVGANVGYFTILMSLLSGEQGTVNALEPSKELLLYLKKNIADRKIRNVTVHPFAAGARNERAYF